MGVDYQAAMGYPANTSSGSGRQKQYCRPRMAKGK